MFILASSRSRKRIRDTTEERPGVKRQRSQNTAGRHGASNGGSAAPTTHRVSAGAVARAHTSRVIAVETRMVVDWMAGRLPRRPPERPAEEVLAGVARRVRARVQAQ